MKPVFKLVDYEDPTVCMHVTSPAEHPKPAPISASDYAKLKVIHLLFGDCWVAKNYDGLVCTYREKPEKHEMGCRWVPKMPRLTDTFSLGYLSWQDTEPLHLTADWLKEVEHG